ncbi:hypothetical protein H0E85_04875 [Lactiplantibacillus plantarum]|uniref:hypothetical protein n=1 Tax=Lactiplantibacillus plantarum TaxID=1590 RepID=UPI0015EBD04A|nr:hypothetical protein [Lactiplantibacillus plantarum]QLQ50930.1 hypothetical protein H0E85_04875 [Lactiplantibacillus plantarum]
MKLPSLNAWKKVAYFIFSGIVVTILSHYGNNIYAHYSDPLAFSVKEAKLQQDKDETTVDSDQMELSRTLGKKYSYFFSSTLSFNIKSTPKQIKRLKVYYSYDVFDDYYYSKKFKNSNYSASYYPFNSNWVIPQKNIISNATWTYNYKTVKFHLSFQSNSEVSTRYLYLVGYGNNNKLLIYPLIIKIRNSRNKNYDYETTNNDALLGYTVLNSSLPNNKSVKDITLSDNVSVPVDYSKIRSDTNIIESRLNFDEQPPAMATHS